VAVADSLLVCGRISSLNASQPCPGGQLGNCGSACIRSTDHGDTWHRGGRVSSLNASSAKGGPNECEPALLGSTGANVLLNMRAGADRLFATSSDGGTSFGKHWRWVESSGAKVANCQGSTGSTSAGNDRPMLLFTAPSNAKQSRANLTLFISETGGQSWAASQVVHAGPSAYSSLAATGGGCVAVAYEGGQKSTYEKIFFRKVCVNLGTGKVNVSCCLPCAPVLPLSQRNIHTAGDMQVTCGRGHCGLT